jgi:hypothetical protein
MINSTLDSNYKFEVDAVTGRGSKNSNGKTTEGTDTPASV